MNSTTAPLWCKVPKFEISKDAKIDIPAYGGRLDVTWDPGTKVTASGGLAYFALFLKTTGLFDRFGYIIDIDNTVKPIFGHQEISTSRRLPRSGR